VLVIFSTSHIAGKFKEQLLCRTAAFAEANVKTRHLASEEISGGHCFSAQNWTLLLSIRVVGRFFWVEHQE